MSLSSPVSSRLLPTRVGSIGRPEGSLLFLQSENFPSVRYFRAVAPVRVRPSPCRPGNGRSPLLQGAPHFSGGVGPSTTLATATISTCPRPVKSLCSQGGPALPCLPSPAAMDALPQAKTSFLHARPARRLCLYPPHPSLRPAVLHPLGVLGFLRKKKKRRLRLPSRIPFPRAAVAAAGDVGDAAGWGRVPTPGMLRKKRQGSGSVRDYV